MFLGLSVGILSELLIYGLIELTLFVSVIFVSIILLISLILLVSIGLIASIELFVSISLFDSIELLVSKTSFVSISFTKGNSYFTVYLAFRRTI